MSGFHTCDQNNCSCACGQTYDDKGEALISRKGRHPAMCSCFPVGPQNIVRETLGEPLSLPVTESRDAELARLRAENARLREALDECITDPGAIGYSRPGFARQRLDAISHIATQALEGSK